MSQPFRLIPKRASLHTKLMLTLVILITLTVAIFATIIIEEEREHQYRELQAKAERIADMANQSIAYSVWNIDQVSIDKLLESLIADPEVIYCLVSAIGYGTLGERGFIDESEKDQIEIVKEIHYATSETGDQKIGEIKIVLTRSIVKNEINAVIRNIWILTFLSLIILYVATYYLLKKVVVSPVQRLENVVDKISQGDLETRCPIESEDELGRLAERVNLMAHRLKEADSHLRESEQRLQLVLEGSQLGYWDWNISTNTIVRNDKWVEILGYRPEEIESTIEQWTELQHPEDRDQTWDFINKHLEGESPSYQAEYRMLKKDGSYIWIHDHGKIVSRDDTGKPTRMCGTHMDITERKSAELDHERIQNQLAHSQKMESIGQLAGGMAHDFNNILNGILSAAQLIKIPKYGLEKKGLKYAEMITQSSLRAADLIKKLLAFSRKDTIVKKHVDIHQIINETTDILKETIDKRISIFVEQGAEFCKIEGDLTAIENALLNMGINASHAMPKGGMLKYRTSNRSIDEYYCKMSPFEIKPGLYIQIDIEDTGFGIPEENLEKIFEPFYTTKEQGEGTGLGLSAVYGTIKDHFGEIVVQSSIGKGTTFSILLSCAKKTEEIVTTNSPVFSGSGKILLVDDENINRVLVKEILESLGYGVLLASDGLESLGIFKERHKEIDLVILDMVMPEMNGSETFFKMKEIDRHCKVIIASGYTQDKNIDDMFKKGLAGYIKKPYNIPDLSKILNETLKTPMNL